MSQVNVACVFTVVYSFPAILTLLAPWLQQCEAASGRVDAAPS